eukprot:TRINITY_DN12808_c0_g1_i12.p1 TRINITY_DN12808_c0_g1~~TRINITY_DN12808_c0_g1_i12.p1  ORF type:complete len:277 (+),score=98.34 TRINITY_DN12808_c0_g1_i12:153-983(+)
MEKREFYSSEGKEEAKVKDEGKIQEDIQELIEKNTEYENALKNEIIKEIPISRKEPFKGLVIQYEGNKYYEGLKKINASFNFIRHSRRDGNCFYRSYLIQLFEFLNPKNAGPESLKVEKKLTESKDFLLSAKYEELAIEDSYLALTQAIDQLKKLTPDKFEDGLIDLVSNAATSNYLLFFLRLITSAYIKKNAELFMNFIVDDTVDGYCQREVEHFDHDCDHIQILALTSYMEAGVIVHTPREDGTVETMKFPDEAKEYPVSMLYLPGHYDPIYKN